MYYKNSRPIRKFSLESLYSSTKHKLPRENMENINYSMGIWLQYSLQCIQNECDSYIISPLPDQFRVSQNFGGNSLVRGLWNLHWLQIHEQNGKFPFLMCRRQDKCLSLNLQPTGTIVFLPTSWLHEFQTHEWKGTSVCPMYGLVGFAEKAFPSNSLEFA